MTACAADRHGTESAYVNHGCRCEDARLDRNRQDKLRRASTKPAYVDGTGVARKLQALSALGWSTQDLAGRLGIDERSVRFWRGGHYPTVTPKTATTVGKLYEQLQGTEGPSPRSRENATRTGWAPPLLWHERNIDDPAAQPERDQPSPSRGVDLDEVRFLESCRESRAEIAKRMGVALESIERAEYRAQERARAAVDRALGAVTAATEPAVWQPDTSRARGLENAR
jgi:hypothetical protein